MSSSSPRRILTISHDDSTAIVANSFASVMSRNPNVRLYNAAISTGKGGSALVTELLERGFFDGLVHRDTILDLAYLANFDAVFFAKAPPGFVNFCIRTKFLERPNRPAVIAAFPGLEFSPPKGFLNRLFADVIIFNTTADRCVFERMYGRYAEGKTLLVGNPSVLARWLERDAVGSGQGVAFLTQNITPKSLGARAYLAHRLARHAESEPITIKLRQLKNDNPGHVHRELFSYETILQREGVELPLDSRAMALAIQDYAGFLSCSSTGVIEGVALGKKGGFITTFPEWERDELHVTSLAYALRYGLDVDIAGPLELRRPNERFFTEFGLTQENPLVTGAWTDWQLPTGRSTLRWRAHRAFSFSWSDVARLYIDVNVPEKGLFLLLAGAVMGTEGKPRASDVEYALSRIDAGSSYRQRFVQPILGASDQGGSLRPASVARTVIKVATDVRSVAALELYGKGLGRRIRRWVRAEASTVREVSTAKPSEGTGENREGDAEKEIANLRERLRRAEHSNAYSAFSVSKYASASCFCCGSRDLVLSPYPCLQDREFRKAAVLGCCVCGISWVPDLPFDLGEYYRTRYADSNRRDRDIEPAEYFAALASDGKNSKYQRRVERHCAYLQALMPDASTVLDYGSGPGYFLRGASRPQRQLLAIEPDEKSEKYLQFLGATRLRSLEEAAGRVDFLLASHSLEHLMHHQVAPVLEQMRGALTSQGVACIEVPSGTLTRHRLVSRHAPHTVFFSPESLERVLRDAGFRSVVLGSAGRSPSELLDTPYYHPTRYQDLTGLGPLVAIASTVHDDARLRKFAFDGATSRRSSRPGGDAPRRGELVG